MNDTDVQRLLKRLSAINYVSSEGSLAFTPDGDEIRKLCDQIRPHLPDFDLSDEEILAIAHIFVAQDTKWKSASPPMSTEVLSLLNQKGIIKGTAHTRSDHDATSAHALAFEREFLTKLVLRLDNMVEPFASLREYYTEWFRYIKRLHEYRSNERAQHPFIADEDHKDTRTHSHTPRLTATEREFQQTYRSLLQRSSTDTNPFPIEELVRKLELNDDERHIVLYLLYASLSKKDCSAEDLLTLVSIDPFDQYEKENYLSPASKLRFYGVMRMDTSRYRRSTERTTTRLSPQIKKWLLNHDEIVDVIPDLQAHDKPYVSNKEFLRDWMRHVSGSIQANELKDTESFDLDDFEFDDDDGEKVETGDYLPILNQLRDLICARTWISTETFPLQKLVEEHGLSEAEHDILLIGLHGYLKKKSYRITHVARMLKSEEFEDEPRQLFQKDSKLLKNGLILNPHSNMPPGRLVLTTYAIETIFGKKRSQTATAGELLSQSELLHEITPQQTLDDLVLPASLMETLRSAVSRYDSGAEDLLREWGIIPSTEITSNGSSLTMIYSGATGTGKTYTAGALANALGRPIVTTDISKLLSYWVGVSEQQVAKLFDEYKVLTERLPKAPVLLLNECDQFFMRRMVGTERSVDRMYNQMQDIFLERLETFNGVMIATTNLVGSMDEAFSRRFHYKLEFPFPDARAREALWVGHLKPPILLDEDVDCQSLAEEYPFNGGQISLIVRNAAVQAAIRRDRICFNDLRKACDEEQRGTFDSMSMKRKLVGFTST